MLHLPSLIYVASVSLLTFVSAQADLCELFGGSALQCQICGYTPSSPVYCVAYNATFDELTTAEDTPIYKNTAWHGFATLAQDTFIKRSSSSSSSKNNNNKFQAEATAKTKRNSKDIKASHPRALLPPNLSMSPASAPNYALLAPGLVGSMAFGYENGISSVATNGQLPSGTLHTFNYACVIPSTNPPLATSCKLTISGSCLAAGAGDLVNGPFAPLSVTLTYNPSSSILGLGLGLDAGVGVANMAMHGADFALLGKDQGLAVPQKCANYSFEAVADVDVGLGLDVGMGVGVGVGVGVDLGVALLLDNVVFNTFSKGYS